MKRFIADESQTNSGSAVFFSTYKSLSRVLLFHSKLESILLFFTVVKKWKPTTYSSTNKWLKNVWHVFTMGYCLPRPFGGEQIFFSLNPRGAHAIVTT